MTTWWEQRTARISQAVELVAAQAHCSRSRALAMLRARAESTFTDLEDTALAVIAGRVRFPPSPRFGASQDGEFAPLP